MVDTNFQERDSLRILGLMFSTSVLWGIYIESILHIYKFSYSEYWGHIWSDNTSISHGILDKIRSVSNVIVPELTTQLHSFFLFHDLSSHCLSYKYFHGNCPMGSPPWSFNRMNLSVLQDWLLGIIVLLFLYLDRNFSHISHMWDSLSISFFPANYNIQKLKYTVNCDIQPSWKLFIYYPFSSLLSSHFFYY